MPSSKWGMEFRKSDNTSDNLLTVSAKNTVTLVSYPLRNSGTDKGYYFNTSIPDGVYDIYVNGSLQFSNVIINNVP